MLPGTKAVVGSVMKRKPLFPWWLGVALGITLMTMSFPAAAIYVMACTGHQWHTPAVDDLNRAVFFAECCGLLFVILGMGLRRRRDGPDRGGPRLRTPHPSPGIAADINR